MKILFMMFVLLCIPSLTSGSDFEIPNENNIFAIATQPFGAKIFTSKSLLKKLQYYRVGKYEETGLKIGDDRVWQGGVIVLKNKKVLFWTTDRMRFLRIFLEDGQDIYLVRDDAVTKLDLSSTGKINALGSTDDFFTRDPEVIYDESIADRDYVFEIPGYKLDPKNALHISIGKEEYEYAQRINPEILEKAEKYVEYAKINATTNYQIYAAKDLGNYILLYFKEPKVADGGFEIIYSKRLEKIIGLFSAGYKG